MKLTVPNIFNVLNSFWIKKRIVHQMETKKSVKIWKRCCITDFSLSNITSGRGSSENEILFVSQWSKQWKFGSASINDDGGSINMFCRKQYQTKEMFAFVFERITQFLYQDIFFISQYQCRHENFKWINGSMQLIIRLCKMFRRVVMQKYSTKAHSTPKPIVLLVCIYIKKKPVRAFWTTFSRR